jgi:hypothetical protein
MSDISIRTRYDYKGDDSRWIGAGGQDLESAETITLERGLFDLVTAFPNGFIPSGVCLGKKTSTGKYGPYGGATSEVQTVTFDATGGTYTLAFDGVTSPNITYGNAAGDAATIKAALEALPGINPGDVTVVRGTPVGNVTIFTITFGGRYIGLNVPQIDATNVVLTGGATTVIEGTTTAGGSAVSDGREVAVGFLAWPVKYDRNSTGDMSAALLWRGEVIVSKLPTNHGLDAAAQAALSKFRFI